MIRLLLVRHGEVDAAGFFYGHLDVPLSVRGEKQMAAVARALAPLAPAAVFCSDLRRAVDGASLIASPHGLDPLPDPAYREMNLGILEGMAFNEVRQAHPELAAMRYRDMWSFRFPGGGENLQDVRERVLPALDRLVETFPDRTVVLVAHNSVNRVVLGWALGLPLQQVFGFAQDFGCVNRIDLESGAGRVTLLNWTPDAPG